MPVGVDSAASAAVGRASSKMAAAASVPVGTGSALTAAAAAAVVPPTGFGSPGLSPALDPLPVGPVAAASPRVGFDLEEEEGEEEDGIEDAA